MTEHDKPHALHSMTDPLISRDPEVLGGTPVFAGTRVPIRTLFDYVEAGDPLHKFLDDYPSVSREPAVAVLKRAGTVLTSSPDRSVT